MGWSVGVEAHEVKPNDAREPVIKELRQMFAGCNAGGDFSHTDTPGEELSISQAVLVHHDLPEFPSQLFDDSGTRLDT